MTDSATPQGIVGNLTLIVNMTDNGEPGTSDTIGFTLWNGSELLFSSNWEESQTIEQVLGGGNLAVHAAAEALRAAGGAAVVPTKRDLLTAEHLRPVAEQAIAVWSGPGFDPQLVSTLAQVELRVADLSGSILGLTFGNTVWIDQDGGGYGWRIDRSAATVSPSSGMDLLSVVSHEFGHVLGLDHGAPYHVMAATLVPGARTAARPDAFKSQLAVAHAYALHPRPILSTPRESFFSVGSTLSVNESDARQTLADDYHAIRIRDQFFESLASRLDRAVLVESRPRSWSDEDCGIETIEELSALLTEAAGHKSFPDEVEESLFDEDLADLGCNTADYKSR